MSRFFSHTAYAEDQPLSHTILIAHVLYRGFQAGTVVGAAVGGVRAAFSQAARPASRAIIAGASRGALVGTALMVVGLPARMWGREEIEWKDRSWRLLENKGQMEVDDWSGVGTVMGGVAGVVQGGGLMRVVGGAGAGSMLGVLGYMGWRYGLHSGKFD